uniref:uncharacterized protein LOC122580020 n=1 Tax=Erigeron canadensis TaxID=72917 RepID=UPI001CB94B0F|nr:uncharacterized protein LOC122580020 [Erigeron canadensis]
MDTDMMDSDAPMTSPAPSPELPHASGQLEVSKRLLSLARQHFDQGKPSQALQAVVAALRAIGGEAAAIHALNRAKELYKDKVHEANATDELASLFAKCAIAEALPKIQEPTQFYNNQSPEQDAVGTSILAETGRKQVIMDAFSDGTSFVCLHCGGIVSINRKDEHYAFWCGQR